jgi:hypothetical protein
LASDEPGLHAGSELLVVMCRDVSVCWLLGGGFVGGGRYGSWFVGRVLQAYRFDTYSHTS